MKKYLFPLLAVLCLHTAPAIAQENGEEKQPVVVEQLVTTTSEDGATITITEINTDRSVNVDSATYNKSVRKGYNDHKIFKNQIITNADNSGMGVTLMSMCIVLAALIILSLLFMFFGKIFAKNQSKKKSEAHGETAPVDDDDHDSGEVIAAIALALDEHFNSKHDLEDTVLTIKRMKRAYSPWNSKIYNMREVPAMRKR